MEYTLSGNTCVFCMFIVSNLALMIVGIGITSVGIFVCVEADNFSWYDGSFVALGCLMILMAILGHKTRHSVESNCCYLTFVLMIFIVHLAFAIGVSVYNRFDGKISDQSQSILRYYMLASSLVILACIGMSYLYRRSLLRANYSQRLEPSLSLQGKDAFRNLDETKDSS